MKDNSELKNGIPPVIRVAMLVRRSNLNNFAATFQLKLKANLWGNARNEFKRVFRLLEQGDPINFNPSADPAGELPDDLDRNNLSVYKDPAKLRQLTIVWDYKTLNTEECDGERFIEKRGLE
jgi:hypothetical protein